MTDIISVARENWNFWLRHHDSDTKFWSEMPDQKCKSSEKNHWVEGSNIHNEKSEKESWVRKKYLCTEFFQESLKGALLGASLILSGLLSDKCPVIFQSNVMTLWGGRVERKKGVHLWNNCILTSGWAKNL